MRYTHPQKAAASVTIMRAVETDVRMVRGWFAQAEPGLGGGKVSLGYGGLSPSEHPLVPPIFGAGLKASLMRTWGLPQGLPADQTLLGPEVDLTLPYVKLSAGYLVAGWRRHLSLTTIDVQSSGELAVEAGTAATKIEQPGGAEQSRSIKYVIVWKRQADGSWKLFRDIWNGLPTAR